MDCCTNLEMKRSKKFLSRVISILCDNTRKSGDPLGFRAKYWYHWASGNNIPGKSECILFTGRMYQMLPYLLRITDLMGSSKGLLSMWGVNKFLDVGKSYFGEILLRGSARKEKKIRERADKILKGIVKALSITGQTPGYLFEEDPYSGALLFDLGLEEDLKSHLEKIAELLERKGVKRIITVDPHSTFILREIMPEYVKNPIPEVIHYIEILSRKIELLKREGRRTVPEELVIHDPCVGARELNLVNPVRDLVKGLGISLKEPENTGRNTACCGGPVEYAFPELTCQISLMRVKELKNVGDHILVTCPICLANLSKYEEELNIRVWDLGEILCEYLLGDQNGIVS